MSEADLKDLTVLNGYLMKLVKISEEIDEKADEPTSSSAAEKAPESAIPDDNQLTTVEYQEPPRGVDPEKLKMIIDRMHSFTTVELRVLLKEVHLSTQGTKKQLRERVRRYYRKEYAMYRIRYENENMSRTLNKTQRHFDYLVAIDFECTCVEIIYDYPHEIIEFPAVLIDVREMKIRDKFRTFVRPVSNPVLDPFCVQLCGIPQDVVDAAPLFPEAYATFVQWMMKHRLGEEGHRYAFVTDGPHDMWKFFQFQCLQSGFKSVPHEFRHFINIKRIFEQRVKKLVKGNGRSGIQNMLAHYNLEFEGQKHSGLDDATNIARLTIQMMRDKIELRVNQRMTRRQDKTEERRLEEMAKMDRNDGSDFHVWQKKLPLKLRQVTREEFLSREYLDCDSCEDE